MDMTLDMLSVLVPTEIGDAQLYSSTVAEPDLLRGEALWVAATSYAVGDRVVRATTHRRYECLIAGANAGLPENTPLRWFDLGASNKWAAFDMESSSPTVAVSPYTVVLRPGHVNTIYGGGLDALGVSAVVKDAPGGAVVATYSSDLEASAPPDYYEYFFDGFRPERDFIFSGLPPYSTMEITLIFTSGGPISVGALVVGDMFSLGETLAGAKVKPRTFSRIVFDSEGYNKIKRGKSAKDLTISALISDMDEADYVCDTIQELLDVPCVIIGSEQARYSHLRTLGLLSAEVNDDEPTCATIDITVQGLI